MQFTLPEYSDLTTQQQNLVDLDLHDPELAWWWENLIVQWFAWTWKTVVAYFRALNAVNQKRKILVLCFGKVLNDLLKKANKRLTSDAKICYLWEFYNDLRGVVKYRIENSNNKEIEFNWGKFSLIWDCIIYKKDDSTLLENSTRKEWPMNLKEEYIKVLFEYIVHMNWKKLYDEIIIDEWQDIPLHIVKNLNILSDHISVFADDNQKIFENKENNLSSIEDIKKVLCPNWRIHLLTENFRTTKQICEYAAKRFLPENEKIRALKESVFCRDDPDSMPKMAHKSKDESFDFIAENVIKNWAKYSSILVICPLQDDVVQQSNALSSKQVNHYVYHNNINNANIDRKHAKNAIDSFSSTDNEILITTYKSAKWLEADCVFIYLPNETYNEVMNAKEWDKNKNTLYVLCTRAKKKLFIVWDFKS